MVTSPSVHAGHFGLISSRQRGVGEMVRQGGESLQEENAGRGLGK